MASFYALTVHLCVCQIHKSFVQMVCAGFKTWSPIQNWAGRGCATLCVWLAQTDFVWGMFSSRHNLQQGISTRKVFPRLFLFFSEIIEKYLCKYFLWGYVWERNCVFSFENNLRMGGNRS